MQTQVPDLVPPDKPALSEPSIAYTKHFCLLHDGIISVNYRGETRLVSLPEAYAALAKDRVDDFPRLRPHQRHFWHATLCQMGAIAMVNHGSEDPPDEPEDWLRILGALTLEKHAGNEPWHLAVDDITEPAFLQPPASAADKATDYEKKPILTPDQMDLPVASKHHDVRDLNMRNAAPEQWLFALIARQTGGGYDGPRLYPISRMNRGSGNRHGFSLTPSTRWGAHISRDLRVLARQHRGENVKQLLLWTRPWDGTKNESIPLHELTPLPLYVEVSRRIRLEADVDGNLKGRYATSQGSRIHAKEAKGRTQDPWTVTQAEQSVGIGSSGFNYRKTSECLGAFLPLLAKPNATVDSTTPMYLVARTIVGGTGKTGGYHERTIPLGRGAARMLGSISEQAKLHKMAQDRLNIISEVQGILREAVKTYLQDGVKGGETKKQHQPVIADARRRLDQAVDLNFWTHLQEELESTTPQRVKADWCHRTLVGQAREILDDVVRSGLCHRKEQYRATAEAHDLFGRRVWGSSKLPELPEEQE